MGALWVLLAMSCRGPAGEGTGLGLRVVAIDVGQGDATLVVGPDGTVVLIDGGGLSSGAALRQALVDETGGRVDHVVVTHFDADHLAGVADLLLGPDRIPLTLDDGIPDAILWDYGDDAGCSSQTCSRYRLARAGRAREMVPGDFIEMGLAELGCVAVNGDVLGGSHVDPSDENSRSISLLLRLGVFQAFLGGDLTGGGNGTADVETAVARVTGHVDLLKVDHHGSATSTSATALGLWSPRAAFISAGTDNSYCHPAQSVLDRLEASGARLYATGGGIQSTTGNCSSLTQWPADARSGLGTLDITAYGDGALFVNGDIIP